MVGQEERAAEPGRRIELPRGHDAAALARRFLEEHYADRVGEVAFTNALLVLSELVTNALLHGEGRIFLCVSAEPDRLRIEVVDEGTGKAPTIREQPDGHPGGWGLRIVDSVASRWGAFEGTTHVWAEIADAP